MIKVVILKTKLWTATIISAKDFVDGAPMYFTEIQEELSHFMLDIENANLQRITRHLIKSIKIVFHLSSS